LRANLAVTQDDRDELELHAIFAVVDADGGRRCLAALGDRDRDRATGEEAGFLAADGDEIGLGEDSQEAVLAKGFDEGLEGNGADLAGAVHRDHRGDGGDGGVYRCG